MPHRSTAPARKLRPFPLAAAIQALFLAGAAAGTLAIAAPAARAQALENTQAKRQYAIPAGPLERVLTTFASAAGVELSADATLLQGKRSAGLAGSYTVRQGFEELLRGQGVRVVDGANGAYALRAEATATQPQPGAPAQASATLPAITISAAADRETATGPVRGYVARRAASATKTDTALNENPQSVSVVTADEISDRNAESLDETLRYTAGVTPNQRPLGSDDSSLLRGFTIETTGILQDGLRNSGRTFGASIEPYGLERLEVLRGPASVLYGQIPPGGMVNAVSKRPSADAVREAGVEYGSYQRRQLKADVGGTLDAPGAWTWRIVMLGREARTRLARDRDNRLYVAPSLTWQAGPATRLTLLARYEKDNQQYAFPNQLLQPGPRGQVDPGVNLMGDDNRFKRRNTMLGYEFEHAFNDTWSLRQNLRYTRLNNDRTDMFPGGLNDDGTVERYFWPVDTDSKSLFADTQLQARFATGALAHQVLLGVDYAHIRNTDEYRYQKGFVEPLDLYRPVYGKQPLVPSKTPTRADAPSRQLGLYAQDQLKWERWVVTAGLRRDKATQARDVIDLASGAVKPDYHQSPSATTGRLGAVYLFDGGWAPYVSYASSFSPELGTMAGGGALKPSRGKQLEAGVRYEPAGQRASYTAAVFDLVRDNVSTSDIGNPGFLLQTGQVKARGVELEARTELASRLSLIAQYTYLDTEVTKSNNGDLGLQQPGAPRHSASAWARQSFSMGEALPAYAALGMRFLGAMRSNSDGDNLNIRNGGLTQWDAALGVSRGPWQFSLNVNNVLNKQTLYDCGYLPGLCYRNAERTANVSAMYRF
ncbi:TonB-dependent siderophore receptor [Janthinobacterium violaceinigrum]|uniref:TonB-dependent siderophore receptor n=1 Tax=Janthinobacterium violaceinigrum TaxID=2654252 RepID=A0A6I1I623_9BURK|nr:TonB-dependent siderophore receptor [Janthinobacterium violaceinigrum]KAB8066412.1 TonB-dependent siderophore receptor [Janthinobacterium violaceinigrum]